MSRLEIPKLDMSTVEQIEMFTLMSCFVFVLVCLCACWDGIKDKRRENIKDVKVD